MEPSGIRESGVPEIPDSVALRPGYSLIDVRRRGKPRRNLSIIDDLS